MPVMPTRSLHNVPSESISAAGSKGERELVQRLADGDESALRQLMDQYDQLVRYTIYRTAREQSVRDPQWLDAVASETWGGFLNSARRGMELRSQSIARYLGGIARLQTISALRRLRAFARIPQNAFSDASLSQLESLELDPEMLSAELESLSALRDCAGLLDDDDRLILSQLPAITQRNWVEAGAVLGLSESTLRSRWGRILDRLRDCLEKKSK